MIAGPVQENLRLVFQAAKRARMNDSGTVALEFRSIRMARLWILAAVRFTRFLGERRQHAHLIALHFLTGFPILPGRTGSSRISCHILSIGCRTLFASPQFGLRMDSDT